MALFGCLCDEALRMVSCAGVGFDSAGRPIGSAGFTGCDRKNALLDLWGGLPVRQRRGVMLWPWLSRIIFSVCVWSSHGLLAL